MGRTHFLVTVGSITAYSSKLATKTCVCMCTHTHTCIRTHRKERRKRQRKGGEKERLFLPARQIFINCNVIKGATSPLPYSVGLNPITGPNHTQRPLYKGMNTKNWSHLKVFHTLTCQMFLLSPVVKEKVGFQSSSLAQSIVLFWKNFNLGKILETEKSTRKYLCGISKYHIFCFTTTIASTASTCDQRQHYDSESVWLIKLCHNTFGRPLKTGAQLTPGMHLLNF